MLFSFGKKRKSTARRYKNVLSSCSGLNKRICRSSSNCTYTKRGCRGRGGTRKGLVFEGPAMNGNEFGKKRMTRRYKNVLSSCSGLNKRLCRSSPNCTYTKRGCRGRGGTRKGLVFEGPSMNGNEFGKKRKPRRVRKMNKLPSRLIKLARKYRVKISLKVGKKRVYKSAKVLVKQIKRKMKKVKKTKRKNKKINRRRPRRFNFGSHGSYLSEYPQEGIIGQSSTWVDKTSNGTRPGSLGFDKIDTRLSESDLPVYGTYSRFFTEKVPKVLPPSWYCNKDSTGACTLVGGPFYGYKD